MFNKLGAAAGTLLAGCLYLAVAWLFGILPSQSLIGMAAAGAIAGGGIFLAVSMMMTEDRMMVHVIQCPRCFRLPNQTLVQRLIGHVVSFFAVLFVRMRWLSALFFYGVLALAAVIVTYGLCKLAAYNGIHTGVAFELGTFATLVVSTIGVMILSEFDAFFDPYKRPFAH